MNRIDAFPVLVGMTAVISLLLELLIVPFGGLLFPFLGLLIATPMSTLRYRKGRPSWLGPRYTIGSLVSILAAAAPGVVTGEFFLGLGDFSEVDRLASLALIATTGSLAGWFAFLFQRWAESPPSITTLELYWRNSGSWKAIGIYGGTIFLFALATFAWTVVGLPQLPSLGPTRHKAFLTLVVTGILTIVGLSILVVGAARERDSRN